VMEPANVPGLVRTHGLAPASIVQRQSPPVVIVAGAVPPAASKVVVPISSAKLQGVPGAEGVAAGLVGVVDVDPCEAPQPNNPTVSRLPMMRRLAGCIAHESVPALVLAGNEPIRRFAQ